MEVRLYFFIVKSLVFPVIRKLAFDSLANSNSLLSSLSEMTSNLKVGVYVIDFVSI